MLKPDRLLDDHSDSRSSVDADLLSRTDGDWTMAAAGQEGGA